MSPSAKCAVALPRVAQGLLHRGKVRYLGFTGHKSPQIHLKMLGKCRWDTVQMPINVCDYFYRSFVHQVVPAPAWAPLVTNDRPACKPAIHFS